MRRRDSFTARRAALGLTQEALAQALGLELSTIGRWERGESTPQPWRRRKLARILRVSLDELDTILTPDSGATDPARSAGDRRMSRREVVGDTVLIPEGECLDHSADGPVPERSCPQALGEPTLSNASRQVAELHRTYQGARYVEATRLLPSVTAVVDSLAPSRDTLRLRCSLHIAAAKLATKTGDHAAAWRAAEQARTAAEAAEDTHGQAAAAYQRTCALLHTGQIQDAEQVAVSAADSVHGTDPRSVTWRGSLTLLGAIIAARRNDARTATRRLDHADELAGVLGADDNLGWTAFGPTNVLIHRLSAAVSLGDPHSVLLNAEQVDITRLPTGLRGRQAQFYLDNAWAHAELLEDPEAVIHLLDTERIAPELVRTNPTAHGLIHTLLARERRHRVPGLRGLAQRTGVAA